MRHLAWAAIAATCITGCAFDRKRFERPAHFQLGANTRSFSTPAAAGASDVAFRESQMPEAPSARHAAVAATAQFTMELNRMLYTGGELEAGALELRGSSYAGAYGVFGAQHSLGGGVVAAELA